MIRESISKHLLACSLTLTAVISAAAQSKAKTNQLGYLGPVSSVRAESIEYWSQSGKVHRGKRKVDSFYRFDKHGRLLEERHFKVDGSILWEDKYVYASHGQLVEANGRHSKFVYLPDRRVYRYDSRGNLTDVNGLDFNGRLVNKHEYAYDEIDRRIRMTSMSYHPEENSKPHQWTYDYYENGRLREERAFSDEGSGFLPTDSLGGPHRKLFIYNTQNKPTLVLWFNSNGNFAGVKTSRYDKRGNELEDVEYDPDGSIKKKTKYKYRFDRFGNAIRQHTYEWTTEKGRSSYCLTEVSYEIIRYRG